MHTVAPTTVCVDNCLIMMLMNAHDTSQVLSLNAAEGKA